jgi:uncharacterized protein YjbJ (UPF0337 family)
MTRPLVHRWSCAHHYNPEATTDKDRVAGSARKAKGSVKEAISKVTGDSKTQAEGAAEKTAGRAQMLPVA